MAATKKKTKKRAKIKRFRPHAAGLRWGAELRQSIRAFLAGGQSIRELAKRSGVSFQVISTFLNNPKQGILLHSAEMLSRVLQSTFAPDETKPSGGDQTDLIPQK